MPAYPLTDITLVLGAPVHDTAAFLDFQQRAGAGEPAISHAWVTHEHDAVNALTVRDGTVATHTLLETIVGGVLGVEVVIADVERQWVRHEDGLLYASISFNADDVRPRAAGRALQQEESIVALNQVATSLSSLDGRAWLAWSSCTTTDRGDDEQLARTTRLMATVADTIFAHTSAGATPIDASGVPDAASAGEERAIDLVADLQRAIQLGCEHADGTDEPFVKELRWLRHRDPLRFEWFNVQMDAFFLGALPQEQIGSRFATDDATGLSFLYLGRERTERLKADPFITPRFHRELAVRSYLTAYALQRLAPLVSQRLRAAMGPAAG